MGASLLVFSNKTDIAGCMDEDEIKKVGVQSILQTSSNTATDL